MPKLLSVRIPIKNGESRIYINLENISYIESSVDKYAIIHMKDMSNCLFTIEPFEDLIVYIDPPEEDPEKYHKVERINEAIGLTYGDSNQFIHVIDISDISTSREVLRIAIRLLNKSWCTKEMILEFCELTCDYHSITL